ncbi:hypothetical protein BYT27DRAFT_7260949 [Phlegmacium glaucopus]|nr:hypothetical protein BYT27DRAFT_7260949 [Phlegmacium glaucopus]
MSLFSNRYFPHAIYAIALTSISINLISHRKAAEDERSRIQAQISVLESVKEQLQSDKPLSNEELEKMKRLVRPVDTGQEGREPENQKEVSWINIFRGRKDRASDGEAEISKWDQQDLEKLQKEISNSR